MTTATLEDSRIEQARAYEAAQSPDKAIESAQFAHRLVDEIVNFIRPGVKESEAKEFATHLFAGNGVERIWHQPYIHFASHTLLTFKEKPQEDYTLQEEDIAFIDIGVVKDGIEGDAGRTVVFGNVPEYRRLQQASEEIFAKAKHFWKDNDPTGVELYDYIHALAVENNVLFNLDPAGHLIGEFPHKGWKKGINNFPEKVKAGCWILEIQICNAAREYGAFYEDLLY